MYIVQHHWYLYSDIGDYTQQHWRVMHKKSINFIQQHYMTDVKQKRYQHIHSGAVGSHNKQHQYTRRVKTKFCFDHVEFYES